MNLQHMWHSRAGPPPQPSLPLTPPTHPNDHHFGHNYGHTYHSQTRNGMQHMPPALNGQPFGGTPELQVIYDSNVCHDYNQSYYYESNHWPRPPAPPTPATPPVPYQIRPADTSQPIYTHPLAVPSTPTPGAKEITEQVVTNGSTGSATRAHPSMSAGDNASETRRPSADRKLSDLIASLKRITDEEQALKSRRKGIDDFMHALDKQKRRLIDAMVSHKTQNLTADCQTKPTARPVTEQTTTGAERPSTETPEPSSALKRSKTVKKSDSKSTADPKAKKVRFSEPEVPEEDSMETSESEPKGKALPTTKPTPKPKVTPKVVHTLRTQTPMASSGIRSSRPVRMGCSTRVRRLPMHMLFQEKAFHGTTPKAKQSPPKTLQLKKTSVVCKSGPEPVADFINASQETVATTGETIVEMDVKVFRVVDIKPTIKTVTTFL